MSDSPEILISPVFAASGVNVALGCLTALYLSLPAPMLGNCGNRQPGP